MRIVFTSNLYLPIMGGSVVVLDRLSRELARIGHQVVILTKTPGTGLQSYQEWQAYQHENTLGTVAVCRFSGFRDSVKVLQTADRVVMIEMSLNWLAAIAAAFKRPLVTHHTHFMPLDDVMRPYRIAQYLAGLLIPAVACSQMIARQWGPHVGVLPNPYDADVFHETGTERDIDFTFAGRFGPEKGATLFVEAISRIAADFKSEHRRLPRIAVAGRGEEEAEMRSRITGTGLDDGVVHFGPVDPVALAALYNRSRFVVIPSVWQEPFGLIGIEALACGCEVLCSDQPGLREATAGLAQYFKTGDVGCIANAMIQAASRHREKPDRIRRAAHLERHRTEQSARCLLESGTHWDNHARQSSKAAIGGYHSAKSSR
jgi:glycosyltransferase involved in cell wall biosynthesis